MLRSCLYTYKKTNMIPLIINPTAIAFTIATTFGVLIHDTQLDRATTVALAATSSFITLAAVDASIKSGESHVHVERASAPRHISALRATLPRVQPRDDDRRYLQSKRLYFGTGDTNYIWPSV